MEYIKNKMLSVKHQFPTLYQFCSFGIVGASSLVVMLLTYYVSVCLGLNHQVANLIAFALSVCNAFYFNFIWVFRHKKNTYQKTSYKFFAVYISTYLLSSFLLFLFVDVMHISKYIAPLINVVINTPINFFLSKYWVFDRK